MHTQPKKHGVCVNSTFLMPTQPSMATLEKTAEVHA